MNDTTPYPTDAANPADPTNPTGATEPIRPTIQTEQGAPSTSDPDTDDPARWFQADAAPTAPLQPAVAKRKRLPARFGTIFWGVLLLAFAGFMIVNSIVPVVQDPVTWLIGGLIAAGAVLVIAGIAAAVRRTG